MTSLAEAKVLQGLKLATVHVCMHEGKKVLACWPALHCPVLHAAWIVTSACAGRDGLPVSEVCRLLGLSPKRYDKRLKFFQQHLGIVEVEQQVR